MAYGQKNYNQTIGNSRYLIRDIGCLLLSICNLANREGDAIDPLGLNAYFRDNNLYMPDGSDGGVRDLLGWGSPTAYDHNIIVRSINGPGWGIDNNSIVKFHYRSFSQPTLSNGQPNMIDHFCLVADASQRLIVDSWDGVTKVSPYGDPVASATYTDNAPQVVTPPPPADTPTVDNTPISTTDYVVKAGDSLWAIASRSGNDYHVLAQINGISDPSKITVGQTIKLPAKDAPAPEQAPPPAPDPSQEVVDITVQAGWGITHVLQAAGYSQAQFENEAEWDRVATLNGSQTRLRLHPGEIVKVYKQPIQATQTAPEASVAPALPNLAPMPIPTATEPVNASEAVEQVPVKVVPVDFRKSYVTEIGVFEARENIAIEDFMGEHPTLTMLKGNLVRSVGTFEKAGKKYHRIQKWVDNEEWYGISDLLLEPYDDPILMQVSDSLKKEADLFFHNLSGKQKLLASLGSLSGLLEKLLTTIHLKKSKGVK